jgi:Protein of unknown function (DUF1236)
MYGEEVQPIATKERIVVGATVPNDVELVTVPTDWGPSLTKYRFIHSTMQSVCLLGSNGTFYPAKCFASPGKSGVALIVEPSIRAFDVKIQVTRTGANDGSAVRAWLDHPDAVVA